MKNLEKIRVFPGYIFRDAGLCNALKTPCRKGEMKLVFSATSGKMKTERIYAYLNLPDN